MIKVLTIFGTRPEAIKLAPIIIELRKYADFEVQVCVTAQHRQMLDQVLNLFGIVPDIDLNLMESGQTLPDLTAKVVTHVDWVLKKNRPDVTLIQGDTTTVMAVSMAAFYRKVPIGHVEAGLRSGDIYSPFPEEFNRRVTGLVSKYHFAPTQKAREALLNEGVDGKAIFVTGNSVIDALNMIVQTEKTVAVESLLLKVKTIGGRDSKLILVTAHRRENFGERFESICYGLKDLVMRNKDVVVLYPVHLNPHVREPVFRILEGQERIILVDPVEYDVMVHLMNASYLVLTDSGGLQEEAPALGKPVLVMRSETERSEGVEAGTAKLVWPDRDRIVSETELLLNDQYTYNRMAHAVNPYGDGRASERIVKILRSENKQILESYHE